MSKEIFNKNEIDKLLGMMQSSQNSEDATDNIFSESLLQQINKVFSFTCSRISEEVISFTRCLCNFSVSATEELSFDDFCRSIQLNSFNALYTWDSYPISINIDLSVSKALLISNILNSLTSQFSDKSEEEQKSFEIVKKDFDSILYYDFNQGYLKTIEQLFSRKILMYFLKDIATDMGRDVNAKSVFIPRLKKLESNSSWMKFLPDDERVILLSVECNIGGEAGFMNICIPNVFIKKLKSMGFLKEE